MLVSRFDPRKHVVHIVPFLRFLRKELEDESIFVYRHSRRGTWVVASWIQQGRLFLELLNLGKATPGVPPCLTREHVTDLRDMRTCSSKWRSNLEAWRDHMRSEDRRELRELEDEAAEFTRQRQYAARRFRLEHTGWGRVGREG